VPYRDPPPRPILEDRLLAYRARRKLDARFSLASGIANALAGMALVNLGLMYLLLDAACPFCHHEVDEALLIPLPWVVLGLPAAIVARLLRPSWRRAPRFALLSISLVLSLCLAHYLRAHV
jgi:hypothetical protein